MICITVMKVALKIIIMINVICVLLLIIILAAPKNYARSTPDIVYYILCMYLRSKHFSSLHVKNEFNILHWLHTTRLNTESIKLLLFCTSCRVYFSAWFFAQEILLYYITDRDIIYVVNILLLSNDYVDNYSLCLWSLLNEIIFDILRNNGTLNGFKC